MITRSQQLLGRPYPRNKAIQHDLVYLEGLYFQGRNAVWSILSEARFLWQVLNLSYSLKRLQTAWCGTGTWRFNSWLVKSLQALGRTACQRYTDCTHRFCTALSIEMFNVFPQALDHDTQTAIIFWRNHTSCLQIQPLTFLTHLKSEGNSFRKSEHLDTGPLGNTWMISWTYWLQSWIYLKVYLYW